MVNGGGGWSKQGRKKLLFTLLLELACTDTGGDVSQSHYYYRKESKLLLITHNWSRRGLFAGTVVGNTGTRAGPPAFLPQLCPLDLSLRSLI